MNGSEDAVRIYAGILLSHRKEQTFATLGNTDGPRGYHTKWNQRQISHNTTYVWNLKHGCKWIYSQNRDSQRKQIYDYQSGREKG